MNEKNSLYACTLLFTYDSYNLLHNYLFLKIHLKVFLLQKNVPTYSFFSHTQLTHSTLLIIDIRGYRCWCIFHLFSLWGGTCSRPMIQERLLSFKRAAKRIRIGGAEIPEVGELIDVTLTFYTVHFSLGHMLVFWPCLRGCEARQRVTS